MMRTYLFMLCMFLGTGLSLKAQDCRGIKPALLGTERQAKHATSRTGEAVNQSAISRNNEVSVYPNPVGSYITIHSQGKNIREVRIYSSTGMTVFQQYYKDDLPQRVVHVSTLHNGFYILRIGLSDQTVVVHKIIKNASL